LKRRILPILLFILIMLTLACGKSNDSQAIRDFFTNANNSEVFQRSAQVKLDLNGLSTKTKNYSSVQLTSELQLLETRASLSHEEISKVVPPKILQSFWNKKVESSRLTLQAITMLKKRMDDAGITTDQISALLSQSNDLSISAGKELQDICEKNGVDISITH
jgi:hypothetical protein